MGWLTEQPIAHRGLHGPDAHENTLDAIDAAIDAGYAVEIDVRLTSDGVPVVFHDETLDRLTPLDAAISSTTWDRISGLSIAGGAAGIPRLSSVLSRIGGREPVLIEIKSDSTDHAIETAVERELVGYDGPFAIQSFNPLSLAFFRKHQPDWPRGQLAADLDDHPTMPAYQNHLLKRLAVSVISRPQFVGYDHSELPYWPVTVHRRLGYPVLAWTVRTESERRRAQRYADNVIFEDVRP